MKIVRDFKDTFLKPYRGTSFFGDDKFPWFRRCSALHDDDYATRRVSRKVADERFRICMSKVVADMECEGTADAETIKQYKRAAAIRYRLARVLGGIMYYT